MICEECVRKWLLRCVSHQLMTPAWRYRGK